MHHGYYPTPDFKDHKAAQVDMIDRSLEWAYAGDGVPRFQSQAILQAAMKKVKAFIDVGCGVGGSSRHIYRKYASKGTKAVGISLSPFQVARATELTAAANLTEAIKYQVTDALKMPFKDNSFNLGKEFYFNFFICIALAKCNYIANSLFVSCILCGKCGVWNLASICRTNLAL